MLIDKTKSLLALALLTLATPALAEFPERPITLVVPYPPGGTIDRLSRELADDLGQAWDVAVIVENHAGGNGAVGVEAVRSADADGYTMLVAGGSTHTVGPATDSNLKYDPIGDFTPIAYLGDTPMVITAGPNFEAADLPAMITLAGAEPGAVSYGSVGNSTVLAGTLVGQAAGVDLRHVNYKQFGPTLIDLVRGDINLAISSLPIVLGNIEQEMVRPLAVTSTERSPLLPDVPAVAEFYPGVEVLIWFGMFGPADLPEDVLAKYREQLGTFLGSEERATKWAAESFNFRQRDPADYAQFIADDLAKWQGVAREAGLTR